MGVIEPHSRAGDRPDDRAAWKTRPVAVPAPCDFVPFPRDALSRSIADRFSWQAATGPERIAVRFAGTSTSYRALDQRSNQIANRTLALRGKEKVPVGLLMSQGAALIAAILGTLKANKIYVPLDPALPVDQLAQLASDAKLQLLIADQAHIALAKTVGGTLAVRDLELDGSTEAPPDIASRDSIAYVYYTSGSTGRPKGIADTHGNVLHNILRYTNSLRISPSDRLTLLQAPTFSGAVSSMFAALLNGATVCPWDLRRDGLSGLSRWIDHEGISIYHSVPSIFRAVASSGGQFDSIRVVRLEGDQATQEDAEAFKRAFGGRSVLVNGLGATECGIVRQYCIDRTTQIQPGSLPIGYPVDDVTMSIVDEDGRAVAEGEIGEVVVASPYLATGYWQRPDLTRKAFGINSAGIRTYRTGDMGRMGSDGCVTLLGRKDFQHKVAGRHIDIGAVEAALLRLPGVRQAAARTHVDERTGALLCGYVVADDMSFDAGGARIRLKDVLPEWSIPSEIVTLRVLPLDTNGKVKRLDLPRPQRSSEPSSASQRPQSPIEAALVGLWASVLGRTGVGLDDDFFALGGNSLQAMRLVSAVEAVFNVALPVSAVFQELKTVAQMASHIQAQRAKPRPGE